MYHRSHFWKRSRQDGNLIQGDFLELQAPRSHLYFPRLTSKTFLTFETGYTNLNFHAAEIERKPPSLL